MVDSDSGWSLLALTPLGVAQSLWRLFDAEDGLGRFQVLIAAWLLSVGRYRILWI